MTKSDVRKVAEEYVLKHKEHYKNASSQEVKQAVEKVAKAIQEVSQKVGREAKARGRVA